MISVSWLTGDDWRVFESDQPWFTDDGLTYVLPESNRYSFLLVDFLVVLTNPSNNDISEKLLKNKNPKLSAHDRFLEQPSSGTLSQKTRTTLIRYAQSKDWNNPHQVRSVKRLEQLS